MAIVWLFLLSLKTIITNTSRKNKEKKHDKLIASNIFVVCHTFLIKGSCGHGTKAVIQTHKSINEWRIRMFRPTDMDPRTKGVIRRPRIVRNCRVSFTQNLMKACHIESMYCMTSECDGCYVYAESSVCPCFLLLFFFFFFFCFVLFVFFVVFFFFFFFLFFFFLLFFVFFIVFFFLIMKQ